MAKPKLQTEGKDYSAALGFFDASIEFNLPGKPAAVGPVRGIGTSMTQAAFQELQKRYFDKKGPNDTQYVTFGREAILAILAQYDCAGIKFYFVQRANTASNQLTLAMVGVDEKNNDLTTPSAGGAAGTTTQQTLTTDWGNDYP